ncbi:MAG: hypothetical protein CME24_02570 [Gemmatimonadetes bacterium]|nr:hypothetical protein [Gemmatimonadota bacterium]
MWGRRQCLNQRVRRLTISTSSRTIQIPSIPTTITFAFESQQRVSLAIYDVVGRQVRTLVRKVLAPGQHSIRWDGLDDQRRAVASGVYLAHLVTPTTRQVRRMSFVK